MGSIRAARQAGARQRNRTASRVAATVRPATESAEVVHQHQLAAFIVYLRVKQVALVGREAQPGRDRLRKLEDDVATSCTGVV